MNDPKITVSIPATSANLGPGFDSFGIALKLANQVTVKKTEKLQKLPVMMREVATLFFSIADIIPFSFSVEIQGDIPSSRGLGSSATVRLGMLLGLNELTQNHLTSSDLYRLAVSLEGHADNAAAALLGGFTIARAHYEPLRHELSPELRFILLIPDFSVSTTSARNLLPKIISIADAAANAADAAVIAAAFATGKYQLLRGAFHDRLHQPFREPLVPYLSKALVAAESVGALGGWLSGSGSTIAALAENEAIAQDVVSVFQQIAPRESQCIITHVDNEGAKILL
ncbi:MAG: homoserine kinase [Chthoniobacterales bacterium]